MTVDKIQNADESVAAPNGTSAAPAREVPTEPLPTMQPAPAPYATTRRKFICAVAAQLVILGCFYAAPATTIAASDTIYLRVRPLDPWDMFRGQYINLRYDASTVPGTKLHPGETVYVAIRKEQPFAIAEKAYDHIPQFDHSQYVYMRGKVDWFDESTGSTGVKYGIEKYYFQEKTQDRFEGKQLRAEVAVDKTGNCILKQVKAM